MKKILLAPLVLALAAGCGGKSKIQTAYDDCAEGTPELADIVTVGDGGKSATVSLPDDNVSNNATSGTVCFFSQLDMSDALKTDIGNTTGLMGRQTETEHGLTYRWSYHPDNGLEMTIKAN